MTTSNVKRFTKKDVIMKLQHHPYANSDKEFYNIVKFLTYVQSIPGYDNNWDVSRINWWRYSYHAQKDREWFNQNAHYWENDKGEVVGLFISEYGRNDFFALADPAYPNLLEIIITWGETVWSKQKKEISTYIFDFDTAKTQIFQKHGYICVRQENNVRYYDMTTYDFDYTIRPGFKIITFGEFGDYDQRVALVKNAFNNPNYTKERLVSLQSSPQYLPDLDLIAVNQEGKAVAYCMGWVEDHDDTLGYIEPMGTHSKYRKMGLASSLAKECFKRLATLGVKTASIASNAEPDISNFLYESLKPVNKKKGFEYKKILESKD